MDSSIFEPFIHFNATAIITLILGIITLLSHLLEKDNPIFKTVCKIFLVIFIIFTCISIYNLINPESDSVSPSAETSLSTSTEESTTRTTASVEIGKSDRLWKDNYFKDTNTLFNVFKIGETKNCYRVTFNYSATPRSGSTTDVTGTRDVYVISKADYDQGNNSGWIKVGSFKYPTSDEVVSVDINWDTTIGPKDVYAMAAIRENTDASVSFSASWGDIVTLYYYTD